ncbi:hypothetical protein CRYUN_Cryun17cG0036300 [Craigia yunnanensis]
MCVSLCLCTSLQGHPPGDFFLADQLTSQVQAFRSLEFYICYFGWGNFRLRLNKCEGSEVYKVFYIVIAIIPFWLRFVQCLRRLFEEKRAEHGLNGLKYFSVIAAVAIRTIYEFQKQKTTTWLVLAAVLNCLLRLAWMQQVLGIRTVTFLHRTALIAVVASLEIIRRGIWNFFRLENEHLNNVGKYRAFKSVP